MNRKTHALGYLAATFTTGSFIPGVIAVWRMHPQPAPAISTLMYVVISIGMSGWLFYGILTKAKPVIIANAIALPLTLSLVLYKYLYG